MVEAHKRNPNILLDILPWGAPGWIGNGKFYSPDMAEYMARFIQDARDQYGLHINYAGSGTKPSTMPSTSRSSIALFSVIISTPESSAAISSRRRQRPMVPRRRRCQRSRVNAAVYAIGAHYPFDQGQSHHHRCGSQQRQTLWASEDQPNPARVPSSSAPGPSAAASSPMSTTATTLKAP